MTPTPQVITRGATVGAILGGMHGGLFYRLARLGILRVLQEQHPTTSPNVCQAAKLVARGIKAMTIQDFVAEFNRRVKPCVGATWMTKYVEENPKVTVVDLVNAIEGLIADGAADHGWLLTSLSFCWDILTEDERIRHIEVLAKGGAHKALFSPKYFNNEFTSREADLMVSSLSASKAYKALERFNKEKLLTAVSVYNG